MITLNKTLIITVLILCFNVYSMIPVSADDTESGIRIQKLSERGYKKYFQKYFITPEHVKALQEKDPNTTLVDVRNENFFKEAHIPGSICLQVYFIKTKGFLKNGTVVLINNGFTAGELEIECKTLEKKGFTPKILKGGLLSWKNKKYELVGTDTTLKNIAKVSPAMVFNEKAYSDILPVYVLEEKEAKVMDTIEYIQFSGSIDALASQIELLYVKQNKTMVLLSLQSEIAASVVTKLMNTKPMDLYYMNGNGVTYKDYVTLMEKTGIKKPVVSKIKAVGCSSCGD